MSDSGDTQAARVADEDQHPALMTMRTRSGRVVRRPSGLQRTPVTSGRRTRRFVIPEQKDPMEQAPEPVEEKPTVCVEPEPVEEKPAVCVLPEPVEEKPAVCVLPETVEEKPAVCIEPETVEEKPALCLEPEPVEPRTDAAAEVDIAGQVSKAAPVEKAPTTPETESQSPKKKPRLGSSVKATVVIPLGKPKSGRVWKDRNKQRFSALVRDSSLCTSWEKKMQAKREKQLVQNYMLQLKEQKAKVKEDKRKRREENLKRRAENERKAEVVQVIRNPAKIKRMKKKQLRQIEKRDTLALLEKSKNNNQNQNNKTKRAKKNKNI
ncbi:coiled-coil domain-containing protein 86 [Phycodurus eques]|uniref:coiled-coil domain-containing protein 86 n=1 Tax=Phycodurus eques TaxID=693459 RepID=UPI002ACD8898|nr:coiled-coil domain-containing protein 86 [Phycodurus eques]